MNRLQFSGDDGTFTLAKPEEISYLYLPLASETGLKSAITPLLGGDSKLDQETFLLEPAGVQTLHTSRSTRNFWCVTEKGAWSATGVSARQEAARFTREQEDSVLTAGFMWQEVRRTSKRQGLEAQVLSFVPPRENVEIMHVRITCTGSTARKVTGVAAIPIYGRSADNLRDHRDVTAMLHRIRTVSRGVLVKPTMSFDEKGHRENRKIYYVLGSTGDGCPPVSFFPTVDGFLGEGGTFLRPRAILEGCQGVLAGTGVDGREAMGALVFPEVLLEPGESAEYIVLLGVSEDEADIRRIADAFSTGDQVRSALEETKRCWQEKVNVHCHTGDPDFDRLMRWVCFQPILRRIYGCSFLPHHDYGRGGRGWRDLWQDCLSLLLMDPDGVGAMIQANFGGVRVDGTNATIIGAGDGNFVADRNGIPRVWMDHAFWPLLTTRLYLDQTGDFSLLSARVPYFKDALVLRGTERDREWTPDMGTSQRTESGEIWLGTVMEHLLVENLAAFCEAGEHNICRLRGADWNDALDMAPDRGESVAFTFAYAGNLRALSRMLHQLEQRGCSTVEVLEELGELLKVDEAIFDLPGKKTAVLERYGRLCAHTVSGRMVSLSIPELREKLDRMADWWMEHLRRQEWIDAGDGEGWFNSYYDNHGRPLESAAEGNVRMMLTGQVFAVLSGTATREQTAAIVRSADRYLYRKELGGYRLNTDFHEQKTDMGRMFGFAYGEKENGAVFSHMAVMYANALYSRGFVREGYRALQSLADAALSFESSRIYPGIPEYFNGDGRGVYHYLTGAASWYMLTLITRVFGVQGETGDLTVAPALCREQFDGEGRASLSMMFAGKPIRIVVVNLTGADWGQYQVRKAWLQSVSSSETSPVSVEDGRVLVPRDSLCRLPVEGGQLTIELI